MAGQPISVTDKTGLSQEDLAELDGMWRRCASRIILSTTLAGSGHPGGSLSSLHAFLLLFRIIRNDPSYSLDPERDRVVMSIGHVSPLVYSVLAELGFVSEEAFLTEFRRAGSAFSGHVEQSVPGVEWNTGNLGQGLSAGAGFALSQTLNERPGKTIVFMGDGEQQKGQIAEARRFAAKFNLGNLIGIVDRNHLQIGGSTEDVMPVRVRDEYAAAGWNVLYVGDGNDFQQLYAAYRRAWLHEHLIPARPTVIVARTVMGKGVSFMENREKYHGSPLSPDDARRALEEIGTDPGLLDYWKERREGRQDILPSRPPAAPYPLIEPGTPRTYAADMKTDCRSAYGNALEDIARLNNLPDQTPKVLGISCDLEGSVKMQGFRKVSPQAFIESGIEEHHAAAMAGALSREGFATFFSTFGVFAVAETYNQHRLNDLNDANVKIVSTHVGLDVGEDGPTHQSIDYIGLLENLFGFSIFMPADPNQTDHIVRYVAARPGNMFIGMGRSRLTTITDDAGSPFFGPDYLFRPGKGDWLRRGDDLTFVSYGSILSNVLAAREILAAQGIWAGVLNMASIKPIDVDAICEAARLGPIVTVEDHSAVTGLGSIVARVIASARMAPKFRALGVTAYGSSGKPSDLYRLQGLHPEGIAASVRDLLA